MLFSSPARPEFGAQTLGVPSCQVDLHSSLQSETRDWAIFFWPFFVSPSNEFLPFLTRTKTKQHGKSTQV